MNEKDTSVQKVSFKEDTVDVKEPQKAVLFVCGGKDIRDYPLDGHQEFGRSSDRENDIAVSNRFVSEKQGSFETASGHTMFTAADSSNKILYKGHFLEPGQTVLLHDGDELVIPGAGEDKGDCIMLVYADTRMRVRLWSGLQRKNRDALTGLYDHEEFTRWWKERAQSSDYTEGALFLLDVDSFRALNEREGHEGADLALQIVSDHLTRAVRFEHQVARWGGDVFVGIIPGSPERVNERLWRLKEQIEETAAGQLMDMTVSIGWVDLHRAENISDVNELIGYANAALEKIKESGRNQIACYTD